MNRHRRSEEEGNADAPTSSTPGVLGIGAPPRRWPSRTRRPACPPSPKDLVVQLNRGAFFDVLGSSTSSASDDDDRRRRASSSSSRSSSCDDGDGGTRKIFRAPPPPSSSEADCRCLGAVPLRPSGTQGTMEDDCDDDDDDDGSSSAGAAAASAVRVDEGKPSGRSRRWLVAIAIAISIAAVALATAACVLLALDGSGGGGGDAVADAGGEDAGDGGDLGDDASPSSDDGGGGSTSDDGGGTTPPSPSTVEDRLRDALLSSSSAIVDASLLSDSTSPQGMAFDWLIEDSIASMRLNETTNGGDDDYDRIVQRYALAVLYFSTAPLPPSDRRRRRRALRGEGGGRHHHPRMAEMGTGWTRCGAILSSSNEENDEGKEREKDHDEDDERGSKSRMSHQISCRYDVLEGIVCDEESTIGDINSGDGEDDDDDKEERYQDDPMRCYDPRAAEGVARRFLSRADECDWFGIACEEEMGESSSSPPRLVVTEIRLDSNDLRGSIPSELSHLSRLRTVRLSDNSLRGTIPPSIGDSWPGLVELDLSGNRLVGTLPASMRRWERLTTLDLSSNDLEGAMSDDLVMGWKNLTTLDLHGNQFTGRIPWDRLGSFDGLERLRLHFNDFDNEGIDDAIVVPSSFCDRPTTTTEATRSPFISVDCPLKTCSCCSRCCNAESKVCIPVKRNDIDSDSSAVATSTTTLAPPTNKLSITYKDTPPLP